MPIENTLLTIFLFGLIILFHEAGHFAAAKASGMVVQEFSIGFGPVLLSLNWGGTRYSLRIVPLGGFVRILGLEPGDEQSPGGFNSRPMRWRLAVIAAGPLMNFVLAALLFWALYGVFGRTVAVTNQIVHVQGRAAVAGIRPGDRLVRVGRVRSTSVAELREAIESSPGRPVQVEVLRRGRPVTLEVTPEVQEQDITGGIKADFKDDTSVLASVQPGGPAAKAGLRPGDRVLWAGPVEPPSGPEVASMLEVAKEALALEIVRQGKPVEIVWPEEARRAPPQPAPLQEPASPAKPAQAGIRMTGRPARVLEVLPGSQAAAVGLRAGDLIQRVRTAAPPGPWELRQVFTGFLVTGDQMRLEFEREGRRRQITLRPVYVRAFVGKIGVAFQARNEKLGFVESVKEGVVSTYQAAVLSVVVIFRSAAGELPFKVAGPVGIARQVYQAASMGWSSYLNVSAAISLAIGLLNLFPLPALDGSRLVFLALEGIRRRRIDPRKEALVHLVGMAILLALVAVITFREIYTWIVEVR